MSKIGRQRRTPEQKIAAREARSTVGYLQRIQREAEAEALAKLVSETLDKQKVAS